METGNHELDYNKHLDMLSRCDKKLLDYMDGKSGVLIELKDGTFEFYETKETLDCRDNEKK